MNERQHQKLDEGMVVRGMELQVVEGLARELVGEGWQRLENPSMGGEDFSFLARESSSKLLLPRT